MATKVSHRRAATDFFADPFAPMSAIPVAAIIPKLGETELDDLWRRFSVARGAARKSGGLTPEAEGLRNELVVQYLGLVKAIAERRHAKLPTQVEFDELRQAGFMGLMEAVSAFDLDRGVKFEAYAKQRIDGAILDELRSMDFAPRLVRQRGHQIEQASREFLKEHGRLAAPSELAARIGIAVEEYDTWLREISLASIGSLDKPATEGESGGNKEMSRGDLVEDTRTADPLTLIEKKELMTLATRGLSRKEKLIVILYYLEELTMKEIGLVLELSESRVCQLHNRIIDQLRRQLDSIRDDLLAG